MTDHDRRAQRRLLWTLIVASLAGVLLIGMVASSSGVTPPRIALWTLQAVIAVVAGYGIVRLSRAGADESVRAATERIQQLEVTNALLHRLASTPNVAGLFKVLSSRIRDLVPCDSVAIALSDTTNEFQVVVARSAAPGQPVVDPPQSHHFMRAGTLIGSVVDTGAPRVIPNLLDVTDAHLDANVLASSGMRSAVILPLATEGLNLGVLMALSTGEGRLTDAHVERLRPVADIVAVAFATQSLARALGRSQMAKDMADVMFSLANEINGALQAIVGHCELLSREYEDPAVRRDLAMVSRQAIRATEVLEQVQGLAETRLHRTTSLAALLEDARLDQVVESATARYDDLLNR